MFKIPSKLAGQQSGFTLIELVIVIVVIGILAAVAIPNFASMGDEAKKGRNSAALGAVKSSYAVALAKAKGASPSSSDIVALMSDPSCSSGAGTLDPTMTSGAFASSSNYNCGGAGITIPATVNSSTQIGCANCSI